MNLARTTLIACAIAMLAAPAQGAVPVVPIPQGSTAAARYLGAPATATPVTSFPVPRHPHMAPNERSNIHSDAYQTDAYDTAGPLGISPVVRSTFHVAECASVTFDTAGRLVTVCVGFDGPRLVLLDPSSLATLAAFALPPRNPLTLPSVFTSFAGGGYFYLDDQDRAVVPTTTGQILIVGERETGAGPAFALEHAYDVSATLPPGDGIVSVLPDWSGRLWFVTGTGVVGLVQDDGTVRSVTLAGETIENSFAVDEDGGVYIVSSHALYRFDAPAGAGPQVSWREPYDRGSRRKPGQTSQGSGTTPTLMGSDLVAITDNADPFMRVAVYRRAASVSGSRLVCSAPVFAANAGSTDQSLIAVGSSLVVENNYGYSGPLATNGGGVTEPGLARVDVGRETASCTVAWTSAERAPSVVPKVSLATGLVYTYTKDLQPDGSDAWYFTAIELGSGATAYKVLTGAGLGFNNNYAPVSIGPDGTAYVGVLGGLASIRDA